MENPIQNRLAKGKKAWSEFSGKAETDQANIICIENEQIS